MLTKYLTDKNITYEEIQTLFPDLAESFKSYAELKDNPDYSEEMNKIGNELLEEIKKRDSVINEFLKTKQPEISEIPEIDIPDIDIAGLEEIKIVGYKFTEAEFTRDSFYKLLSILELDFTPKRKGDKYFWDYNNSNYIITDGMPFTKTTIYVIGEGNALDKIFNAVQVKISTYKDKEAISSLDGLEIEGATEFVDADEIEPVSGLTFRNINEAILSLFQIKTQSELKTILTEGRKAGCGCIIK